jgi:hypothetical protein
LFVYGDWDDFVIEQIIPASSLRELVYDRRVGDGIGHFSEICW